MEQGGGPPPKSPSSKRAKPVQWTEAHFEPINTWWEKPQKVKGDPHWEYLEHNGLMFHPYYVPHGVPMTYDGVEYVLPSAAEEVANFWCQAAGTDYEQKEQFRTNFWDAFVRSLPEGHPILGGGEAEDEDDDDKPLYKVQDAKRSRLTGKRGPVFEKADFSRIAQHLQETKDREKEQRRNRTKEERLIEKQEKNKKEGPYIYCLHDFIREKVASYKAEVPGLFRGRGEHPKMGRLKRRILPDEVTLNLSRDAPVPRLPEWLRGHAWHDVLHDPLVTWLAFYRDSVTHSFKYMFMGASSAVKGSKDYQKYELARQLKTRIDSIRRDYVKKMKSTDRYESQLGVCTYVIDALALRVGNEKDKEEEADTVGCCSLRVEHISEFDDDNNSITLDFLGKDSIRYLNTVTLDPLAYKKIRAFVKSKQPGEDIFDQINPTILNRYLRDLMPGLSAKVFRTYNASYTLQQELKKAPPPPSRVKKEVREEEDDDDAPLVKGGDDDDDDAPLVKADVEMADGEHPFRDVNMAKKFYEDANRAVAILCNHQRSIPRTHQTSMAKLEKQLQWMEEDMTELEDFLRSGCQTGEEWKWNDEAEVCAPREEGDPVRQTAIKPNMRPETARTRLTALRARATNQRLKIKMKDENKTVANNTSKQHYMDPRITVAFCKKFDLPIEKFFNATLMKKFPWAMFAKLDFEW